jgi:hypothetical protein
MYKKRFTLNSLIIMIVVQISSQATIQLKPMHASDEKEKEFNQKLILPENTKFSQIKFEVQCVGEAARFYINFRQSHFPLSSNYPIKPEEIVLRILDDSKRGKGQEWKIILVNQENFNDGIYVVPDIIPNWEKNVPEFYDYQFLSWNEEKGVFIKSIAKEKFELDELKEGVWSVTSVDDLLNLNCFFNGVTSGLKLKNEKKYVYHTIGNEKNIKNDSLKIQDYNNMKFPFLISIKKNEENCFCFVLKGYDQEKNGFQNRNLTRSLGVLNKTKEEGQIYSKLNFVTPDEGNFYWYLDNYSQNERSISFNNMYLKTLSGKMVLDRYEGKDLRVRNDNQIEKNKNIIQIEWEPDSSHFYDIMITKIWKQILEKQTNCFENKQESGLII